MIKMKNDKEILTGFIGLPFMALGSAFMICAILLFWIAYKFSKTRAKCFTDWIKLLEPQ